MKESLDRYTGELVKGKVRSNRYVPVSCKKEPVDPFTRTERGYVPPTVQIADMMNAGLRLAEERRARFDSVDLGTEDPPLDPMREPGLDLADVSRLAEKAKNAATALQEAVRTKEKEKADAAKKAELQAAVEKELQARQAVK